MKNNELLKEKVAKIFGEEVINKLDFNSLKNEKDIFSSVYEKILNKSERKKYAQFFTHMELIDFFIKHIPIKNNDKFLDLSCGVGAFLSYLKNNRNINVNNLYGIDIDSKALDICKANLSNDQTTPTNNLLNKNTLNSNLKDLFPDVYKEGGFDIIVGNPPFQNLIKKIDYEEDDSIYKEVLSGVTNSATLMIAKGYEFLKEGGFLGFVLPKNIIRVDSFTKLRKFLINKTKIMHIYDIDHYFKDVRGDQILLVFQKKELTPNELNHNLINIHIHRKGQEFNNPYTYTINQAEFKNYSYFPVFYDKEIINFEKKFNAITNNIDSISGGRIFRGLGISMNSGLVQSEKNDGTVTIYRGDSIARFGIKYPLYINSKILIKTNQDRVNRLKSDKIILQNLCSKEGGLFATFSSKDELNLDTVTNILIEPDLLKYCLGVINSIIANFYIIFLIFLNSNFTMHTDKMYIGKIPIIIPTKDKKEEIEKIVDILMNINDKYCKEFFDYYNKLNEILFDIYGFSEDEKKFIKRLISEVMGNRYNGR